MNESKNVSIDNIEKLSDEQLKELNIDVDAEIKKRSARQRQEAKKKIIELAQAHNIKLNELAGQEKIYVNPTNPWVTWNGKGRKPKWINEALAQGKKLSDLESS